MGLFMAAGFQLKAFWCLLRGFGKIYMFLGRVAPVETAMEEDNYFIFNLKNRTLHFNAS